MMIEQNGHAIIWRPIPGHVGYEASSDGQIRSLDRMLVAKPGTAAYAVRGRILKLGRMPRTGYPTVFIAQTKRLVHRLVAAAFIPNPDSLPVVNHKNGVKIDNRIENLEWTTMADNLRHAVETGLNPTRGSGNANASMTEEQVAEMRLLYALGVSVADLSRKFGLGYHGVHKAVRRESWKHVP